MGRDREREAMAAGGMGGLTSSFPAALMVVQVWLPWNCSSGPYAAIIMRPKTSWRTLRPFATKWSTNKPAGCARARERKVSEGAREVARVS